MKYPNAVCLALEQDYEETQSAPSMAAEHGHYGTYEIQAPMGLRMPTTSGHWGTTPKSTAPATTARLPYPCSWPPDWVSWARTGNY